jgi:hypothetical protein
MQDQIMQLVQQHAPQVLSNNPEVPASQQQAVAQEATHSIFSGMQQMLQTGGPGALKGLFQGAQAQDPNNPQVQQISNQFAGNLSQKMGISGGVAKSIGAALIPMVLSQIFNRTKDPNDHSFNIKDMLGSLMGGGGAGMLGGVLGNVLGHGGSGSGRSMLDRNGDGKTDLSDLMGMFH